MDELKTSKQIIFKNHNYLCLNKKKLMGNFKKIFKYLAITLFVLVVTFLIFYRFWFLRCPDRKIEQSENTFVSPANGEIVSITKFNQEWINVTKEKFGVIHLWTKDVDTAGYIISIQMNPTHVHYQRMPVDGKIIAHKHTSGSFNNAVLMSNDLGIRFENEHNEILFENKSGEKFKIVQIAGFVARRIVDFVKPDMEKNKGDLIGLIKLGSQVTVVLPYGYIPNVEKGNTVTDGETVLAIKKDN